MSVAGEGNDTTKPQRTVVLISPCASHTSSQMQESKIETTVSVSSNAAQSSDGPKNPTNLRSILPLFQSGPTGAQPSQCCAIVGSRRSNLARMIQGLWEAYITDYASGYKTLFTMILLANIVAMASVLPGLDAHAALLACSDAAIANFTVAILVRQPYIINLFYHAFWKLPRSAPLWLRHTVARFYEYGGVHSGAACSSFVWFSLFAGYLIRNFVVNGREQVSPVTVGCVSSLVLLLTTIIIFALPQMRRKYHDLFEQWHRFVGWLTLVVFWAVVVLHQRDELRRTHDTGSIGLMILKLPITWPLIILSLIAIFPWLLLRRVSVVRTENLSDHAVRIYFDPKEKIIPTHGLAISKSPLREWHSFAALSDVDGSEGGSSSIVVSRAGDWTSDAICNPAPFYYMKGIHMAGPGTMAKIFRRVVFMCTGSGAGPVLAALPILRDVHVRLIWSAPSPRNIFGDKICDALLKADPEAIIWDTRQHGRPDLVEVATQVYQDSNAEALFFISNWRLTKTVIASLRRRGQAAYAPIFDS